MMSCEGCKTKIDTKQFRGISKCVIKTNAPKRNCPCESCVVKPMCSRQCKPFYDLVASIFKMSLSYDYKAVNLHPNIIQDKPYYDRLDIY